MYEARNISRAIHLAFGIPASNSICLRNKQVVSSIDITSQNDVVVIDPSMSQNEEYVLNLIKTPRLPLDIPAQGTDREVGNFYRFIHVKGEESSSDSESLGTDSPTALSPRSPRSDVPKVFFFKRILVSNTFSSRWE